MTIVELSRDRNNLTKNMHKTRNIRMSDTMINKTPNYMTIAGRINKRLTISGTKTNNEFHGSLFFLETQENCTFFIKKEKRGKIPKIQTIPERHRKQGRADSDHTRESRLPATPPTTRPAVRLDGRNQTELYHQPKTNTKPHL